VTPSSKARGKDGGARGGGIPRINRGTSLHSNRKFGSLTRWVNRKTAASAGRGQPLLRRRRGQRLDIIRDKTVNAPRPHLQSRSGSPWRHASRLLSEVSEFDLLQDELFDVWRIAGGGLTFVARPRIYRAPLCQDRNALQIARKYVLHWRKKFEEMDALVNAHVPGIPRRRLTDYRRMETCAAKLRYAELGWRAEPGQFEE